MQARKTFSGNNNKTQIILKPGTRLMKVMLHATVKVPTGEKTGWNPKHVWRWVQRESKTQAFQFVASTQCDAVLFVYKQ
jgi:hypothetical protein